MHPGEELRYLILAIQREGNRQLAEALQPLNLTPSQAEVIQVLQTRQPMTLLQLGEHLVCENGSPSRLIKSMVEAGWVEKLPNPQDGRAVLLRLSPAAASVLPRLTYIEQQFNEHIAGMVDQATLRTITDQLWSFAKDSQSGMALIRRKNTE